jgi:hypothetical protein
MMHALCNAIDDVNIFRQAGSRLAITCQNGVGTILGAHSCRGTHAAGDVVRNPSKIYAVFGASLLPRNRALGLDSSSGRVNACLPVGGLSPDRFAGTAIADLVREYPGIIYEVRVAGSGNALAALARDDCDIAITFEPEPHNDVSARVDEIDRHRRGFEFRQYHGERARLGHLLHLMGQHACYTDVGNRRIDRGFGCIDDETRSDSHRDLRFSYSECPHIRRHERSERKIDAVVVGKVLRDLGSPASLEVFGASAYDVANVADPHPNQASVPKLTHPNRKSDVIFRQIERSIFEHQLDIDIRILLDIASRRSTDIP